MTKPKCLPSRCWYPTRQRMYEVYGRISDKLMLMVPEDYSIFEIFEEEGERMDWTRRRDCHGHDIYQNDIVRHIETGHICLVQKFRDSIAQTEGLCCLVEDDCTCQSLPIDMHKYQVIGDIFITPHLIPNKLVKHIH